MEGYKCHDATTIMDLPDDCLVIIFKRLGDECSRSAFGLTCTRWLEIQSRNRLSLQLDCSITCFKNKLSSTPHKVNTYELHRVLTRFPHLRSLSLSGCTVLPDAGLKLLQSYGSSLRALHLDCCFSITDNGLSFVASGCPLLMYISLYRCNITDWGLEILAMSCLNLEDVNLTYCARITDDGVNFIVQNCPHLYGIRINNCEGIKGVGFHGCSQTLAYLEAESCRLEPHGITSILSGGGLEYLNIMNLSGPIYADGFSAIGWGFAKMLRVLNMRLCRVRDDDVAAIAKGCPSLVEWNLALCRWVRLAGWKLIAENCHNLERLHVNQCFDFCELGLEALKNGCKNLRVLYLNRSDDIDKTAIELFRLSRGDIIKYENLVTNPNWQYRWQQRIFEE